MKRKTIYYTDEINDDFAATRDSIKARPVSDDYCYDVQGVKKVVAWGLYRVIATPVVFFYCRVVRRVKIKNRRVLRTVDGGCFLYGNHTQNVIDAFLPTLVSFPKRCDVITRDDAVSIFGLKNIVKMLGALPLPSSLATMRSFSDILHKRIEKGREVAIYPEAHIWPYYNKIRPFPDNSFSYPVSFGVPAVPYTVTYKKSALPSFLPPKITVYIGEPIYPDKSLSKSEARKAMRDAVYNQMCDASADSYEHIKYIKKDV